MRSTESYKESPKAKEWREIYLNENHVKKIRLNLFTEQNKIALVNPHLMKRPTAMEVDQLRKLATAENHLVIHPTHVLKKNDNLVGYLSIGAMPIVMSFFSKQCQARDSMKFIEQAETHMRALGQSHYYTTCADNSPFFPFMQKLGFVDLGSTHILRKEI